MNTNQPLRALTVKQPFASLITWGVKDVENRSQKTNIRGKVLIHAGAQWYENVKNVSTLFTFNQGNEISKKDKDSRIMEALIHKELPLSAIIGEVEIVDCVQNHPSVWAIEGYWHWVLKNAVMYPNPIFCRGALSFWKPKIHLADVVYEQRFLAASKNNYQ